MSNWPSYPLSGLRVGLAFSAWKTPIPPHRGAQAALRRLAEEVAAQYGYGLDDLTGPRRTFPLAWVRQELMARAYATGKYSLPNIGAFLNRDHTTILHGVRAHHKRAGTAFTEAQMPVRRCKMSPPGHGHLRLASTV